MFTLERAQASRRVGWVSMLGLILVPLLVAGGFLWATWNSSTRLDRVQAAIVNNDEGVTLNKQFVPLGRQLAGGTEMPAEWARPGVRYTDEYRNRPNLLSING